tara:strand:+ start:22649 stop:24232 length:1584 start_codon:yes stop_codon:yes gene_type:complete
MVWESHSDFESKNIIKYPDSSSYIDISNTGRERIDEYFSRYYRSYDDIYIQDYLKKSFDLEMLDYSAFREASSQIYDSAVVIDKSFKKSIYEKKKKSSEMFIKYFFSGLIFLTIVFCRNLFYSLVTKNKISIPKSLYVRKKPYDDLGFRDIIFNRLKDKHGHKSIGSYISFSRKREELGNYYLNSFHGSSTRVIKSYINCLSDLIKTTKIASSNGIGLKRFFTLINGLFNADYMMKLSSLIYFGVLLDKPFFVLLSRYKNANQKILGINESFFYPPFRSFDYNHLDTYYSMNEIDYSNQNKFGGLIKENKNIEFFRGKLITKSEGISRQLQEMIDKHKKVVILAPIQIASKENGFLAWSRNDLINFVYFSLKIAKENSEHLFVLKGKKSELSFLTEEITEKISTLDNVFVIESKKPRDLRFNQFEDLLNHADLVISMSHTSTTIWQSLSNKIPAIAINDSHPPSFLAEYEFLEVRSSKLKEAYDYWIDIDSKQLDIFLKEISDRVNLGSSIGLLQVADDISEKLNGT